MWRRCRVLVPGFAFMALLAMLFARGSLSVWQTIMAAHLAPLVLDSAHVRMDPGGWGLMLANLAMLLAHPIKPNPVTAIWTFVGLLFWGFAGFLQAVAGA